MKYSVKIFSRIGELIQGILPDGSSFLVSGLPSRLFFSEATLEDNDGHSPNPATAAAIAATAPLPPKTQQALTALLQACDNGPSGARFFLRLYSNIPASKGLSSSSTDILSVLYLVNDYLQAGYPAEDLYRFAAGVEPTDPCLSEDILLFKQDLGIIDAHIALPPMDILYFDAEPDRLIDTLTIQRSRTTGSVKFYDRLLRRFLQAAATGDYEGLFDSISDSAEYNQTVIALPRFDEYLRLARETSSGLMVAHSGTIMGLLTRPQQAGELQARLETASGGPVYSEQYSSPLLHL